MNSILVPMNAVKTTKAILNTGAGAKAAAIDPIATPTIAGTVQSRTTSVIAAPFFLCAI